MKRISRMVVPVDFSPFSKRALRFALVLARFSGARIHLLHVIPEEGGQSAFLIPLPRGEETRVEARHWADGEYDGMLAGEDVEGVDLVRELLFGEPASTIAGFASEIGADLIVIATHGRSGFEHAVFGSVAEKVLRLSQVSVLMVKE